MMNNIYMITCNAFFCFFLVNFVMHRSCLSESLDEFEPLIIQGLLSFNFCDELPHKEDLAKLGYRSYY